MKKLLMVLAATLICGASLLTSCSKEEPAANSTEPFVGYQRSER